MRDDVVGASSLDRATACIFVVKTRRRGGFQGSGSVKRSGGGFGAVRGLDVRREGEGRVEEEERV